MIKIAIDGPAGAGKSTVAKKLAVDLGFQYIDTGAMYRGSAFLMSYYGISGNKFFELLKRARFSFSEEDDSTLKLKIDIDGETFLLDKELREPKITELSGKLSAIKEVREILVEQQRYASNRRDSVLEGRDTTTVIAPDAILKIFLIAQIEERAKRRLKDYLSKGFNISYDEVVKSIVERDKIDKTRKCSPLIKPKDAIEIDTTNMTISDVVEEIKKLLSERLA
ncbi:MAG: (d)CMP kinase [Deferribacterota bacterium]|nr:(d)CMP kinase [Deferribacterota bacterium]